MPTTQPRIPAFVSRAKPETRGNAAHSSAFIAPSTWDNDFVEGTWSDFAARISDPVTAGFDANAPNIVHTPPGIPFPSEFSSFGWPGRSPSPNGHEQTLPVTSGNRNAEPRAFAVAFQDEKGRVYFAARVSRKIIFAFFVAIILMTLGIQSIPGALDFLINIIW